MEVVERFCATKYTQNLLLVNKFNNDLEFQYLEYGGGFSMYGLVIFSFK